MIEGYVYCRVLSNYCVASHSCSWIQAVIRGRLRSFLGWYPVLSATRFYVRLTFEPSKLEALADIVISLGLLTGCIRVAFLDYLGTTHDSAIALTVGLYSSCKQLAPYCLLGDSTFCNGPGILSLSESVLMDIDVTVAREDDDDEFINSLMNSI